jgi:hypothetical protein
MRHHRYGYGWFLRGVRVVIVSGTRPRRGRPGSARDEAESGRGLMLVDALSEQWGWCPSAGNDGKFVWTAVR